MHNKDINCRNEPNISQDHAENLRLRQRIELLECVLENLPHDLAVFDSMHRYVFINKKAIKSDEMRLWLINKTDFDYCNKKNLSSQLAEQRDKIFRQVIESGAPVSFEEVKADEVISRNFIPITEHSAVKYIIGYAYDVSQIKQLEQRLVVMNAELTKSMATITEEHNKELIRGSFRELIFRAKTVDFLCQNFVANCVKNLGVSYAVINLYSQDAQIHGSYVHFSDLYKGNLDVETFKCITQQLVKQRPKDHSLCTFDAEGENGMAFAIQNEDGLIEGCLLVGGIKPAEGWKIELLKEKAQIAAIKIIELNTQNQLKKLNETLLEQVEIRTRYLKQVNESLEKFSATVSHDLKSPLRQISAFCYLLKKEKAYELSEDARSCINYIEASSKKLEGIVTGLLNFARLGAKKLSKTNINTEKLVKEILQQQMFFYPHAKFKIEVNVPEDIYADTVLISQVFTNLISNAIKYSSKKELIEIEIRSEKSNGFVYISIADNGVGFDNSAKELFQPFKRLHTCDDFEGTGLGLATVASIVQKHGGEIKAESTPGKGAIFTISLPTFNV